MELQLDQFKVGDILTLVGELEEFRIEKVWLSRQGSYKWVDYELRGHRSQRRVVVSVEYDDGEWEVVLYESFPGPDELPGASTLPEQLSWQGKLFRREEKGRCVMRLVSAPGEDLACTYADYLGPGGAALSIELFGDPQAPDLPPEVEIYAGRMLKPHELRLYAPVDLEARQGLIHGTSTRLVSKRSSSTEAISSGKWLFLAALLLGMAIILVVLLQ